MDWEIVRQTLLQIDGKFSNLILSSNYQFSEGEVSWNGYQPGIDKGISYARVYERLLNNRQYSFLLIDNSFIQFFFRWDDAGLRSARLAYYPAPVRIAESQDDLHDYIQETGIDILEEFYFGLKSWMEIGIEVVNTSELRVDYDREVSTHPPCHLQLSALGTLRVEFDRLVNPLVFWNWILEQALGDSYQIIAEKRDVVALLQAFRKRVSIMPPREKGIFLSSA